MRSKTIAWSLLALAIIAFVYGANVRQTQDLVTQPSVEAGPVVPYSEDAESSRTESRKPADL